MYLKAQLERYSEEISDPAVQKAFRKAAESITYAEDGSCPGAALDALMTDPTIGHFIQDFHDRHLEFLTIDDFVSFLERRQ